MGRVIIYTPRNPNEIDYVEVNRRTYDLKDCKGFTVKWEAGHTPTITLNYYPPEPIIHKIEVFDDT